MNAQNVKDLKLVESAAKAENHEPWMDFMEEAKEKIEKCFRNKLKYNSGYCMVREKLSAQPVDLWGWATLTSGIIEMKVQYGMGGYMPQKYYHFSLHNWDVMWMSPEHYTEMVCRFMEGEKKASEQAEQKKENEELLASQAKYQAKLERKRVELIEKDLEFAREHPWKHAFRLFKERHIVKDMTPVEDLLHSSNSSD